MIETFFDCLQEEYDVVLVDEHQLPLHRELDSLNYYLKYGGHVLKSKRHLCQLVQVVMTCKDGCLAVSFVAFGLPVTVV